jgi:acyl-CoA thioester hydrolase
MIGPESKTSAAAILKIYETKTRVRYADTDATGVAYYASYLRYFEEGRIEMFRELGLPYDRRLPIVELRCRYRAAAVFDDLLAVETFVEEVRTKAFRIGARLYRANEGNERELLAEGYVAMVTLDDEDRPVEVPVAFREAFAR